MRNGPQLATFQGNRFAGTERAGGILMGDGRQGIWCLKPLMFVIGYHASTRLLE